MIDTPVKFSKSRTQAAESEPLKLTPDFSGVSDALIEYRQEAWKQFQTLPLPNDKDEAWKRTSLRTLNLGSLVAADPTDNKKGIPEALTKPLADDLHGGQIIFSDAGVIVQLDEEYKRQGVIFSDLAHAQSENPEILKKLIKVNPLSSTDKFAMLATAFATNGVLLYVPKNVRIEKPLHSLFWTNASSTLHAVQVFVYLEEQASATYVLESSSPQENNISGVHAGVIEVYAGPGSKLNFVELQSFGPQVWNFTRETVNVDRDAEVDWIFGALGSHLTKNYSDLNLVGQGAVGKMSGFYFTNGDQHLDHDTQQNHLAPNTTSDLLFKGALLGESRSVWQGMIYVAENASRTDGYQANRNLVLSEKARADSIPGLEILTDDVRCTHGATVGRIDADQVFYLESRGIPRRDAEKLIVEGFFDPIMQRIPFEGVRNRFQQAIEIKMSDY